MKFTTTMITRLISFVKDFQRFVTLDSEVLGD